MAVVEVRVCDRCKEVGKPTEHFEIKSPDGSVEVDLCKDDQKTPLSELMQNRRAAKKSSAKRTATKRTAPRKSRRSSFEDLIIEDPSALQK